MSNLMSLLESTPVVPLVQATDPDVAVKTTRALVAGGLKVIEVVLRTDNSLACLKAITEQVPEAITGAGTVLTEAQCQQAIDHGATFIVSPGLTEGVVKLAQKHGLPILPGIATATELQQAYNYGLRTLKFFPASLAGGPKMLKAMSSVFRDVRFMPTGGVNTSTLGDYLAVPAVLACGGSWLTPADEIAAGNYDAVTKIASEAAKLAQDLRS